MQSKEEKHRNEELVEQLKPFLQQADKIMIKATTLIKRVDRKEVVTDSEKKKAALKVVSSLNVLTQRYLQLHNR